MEPTFSIDLTSVAGIIAATILIVHQLKGWLASTPGLQRVPVAGYVMLVSCVLTLLAHDVLHSIGGSRGELLVQAILGALASSGLVEWWRAGGKPLESSTKAIETRIGAWLLPLLLVVGLSTVGCASLPRSVGVSLVQAEAAIHDALGVTIATANRLCDSKALSAPTCIQFNEKLIPVIKDADAFNRAIRSNTTASIPTMILSLDHLATDLQALMPDAAMRAEVLAKVNQARGMLRAVKGGK